MQLKRRTLCKAISLMALTSPAHAQSDYPARPITIIVPFPPGGVTDVVGREIAKNLARHLKQTVVVENKAGAGGNIGTQALARSKSDGYTLGIMTVSAMSIAPRPRYRTCWPITSICRLRPRWSARSATCRAIA